VALPLIRELFNLRHLQELVVVLCNEHVITWSWWRWGARISTRDWLEINVQVLSAPLLNLWVSLVRHSVRGVHTMSAVPRHCIVRVLSESLLALMEELIWVESFTILAVASVVLRVGTSVKVHMRADIVALVVLTGTPLIEALRLVVTIRLQLLVGWACQEDSEVALNLLSS
jgi:hypothetical protein